MADEWLQFTFGFAGEAICLARVVAAVSFDQHELVAESNAAEGTFSQVVGFPIVLFAHQAAGHGHAGAGLSERGRSNEERRGDCSCDSHSLHAHLPKSSLLAGDAS